MNSIRYRRGTKKYRHSKRKEVPELIKSMKIKPSLKILLNTLPAMITHVHDTGEGKINIESKISKITKHISDFSDIEDIVDE